MIYQPLDPSRSSGAAAGRAIAIRAVPKGSTLALSVATLALLGACDHRPTAPPERPDQPPIELSTVPAPAGIVSWLPGEGNPDDIVGTNDGTLVGTVTYGTGQVGQAFELDKSTHGHVNLGNDATLHLSDGGDFSMEAWVKFNSTDGDMSILDKMYGLPTVNADGWRLLKQADNHIWFCLGGGAFNACGNPSYTLFSVITVTAGPWYHVAAVVDATNSQFSLYVNGAHHSTKVLPGFNDTNSSDLRLGLYATEPSSALDGLIDEATFYSQALSGPEIQDIYDAGSDGKSLPNTAPTVGTDTDPLAINEGQTATNTGTVDDSDGDAVALSASVGSVTDHNDGTWTWSFNTSDGPAESQTVTIDANDGHGGTARTSFTLTVNNVAPTVTAVSLPAAPTAIGDQPIAASGTFTDPAGIADEPYTCAVDFDDGSGPRTGSVTGTTCTGPNQTYSAPGIYAVTVAATDKDGDSGSLTAESFIVVYDPSGGFVTGGGWIDSPNGAYKANQTLTGRANFGFVSKYKKGASTPTGNTEFQFKVGDLNFHSSSYDFLVITQSGTNATFKGSGTVNGELAPNATPFRFVIWAGDDDPDTFRIRIWWEASDGSETDVYDNGFHQEIGGGSIVIHTNK